MDSAERGTPPAIRSIGNGARTLAEGKHQFTVNWNSIPIADLFYVTVGTTVESGALFTPMIAGDVNGDGYLNDRAFVFDPARTADTALPRRCDRCSRAARRRRRAVLRSNCSSSRRARRVRRRG